MIEEIIGGIITSIIIGVAIWLYKRIPNNIDIFDTKIPDELIKLGNLNPLNFIKKRKLERARRTYTQLKESTVFFSDRFAEAFPGCRDIEEINIPSKALDRLDILLRDPLSETYNKSTTYPVWWWRGYRNIQIHSYKRIKRFLLKRNECLINEIKHYQIKKVIAFSHPSYFRKFVYVEVRGMKPTGLYPLEHGYKYEEYGEYGRLKKKYVTREDYDDGATIINGKPKDIRKKVKLRSRVLKDFNFLIAPNRSPINNPKADQVIQDMLEQLLTGKENMESLRDFIFSLPRKEENYID